MANSQTPLLRHELCYPPQTVTPRQIHLITDLVSLRLPQAGCQASRCA